MLKPLLNQLLAGKYDQTEGAFQFHPVVVEVMSWLDGNSFDYAGQSGTGAGPRLGKFVQRCFAYVKSILEAQMFMSKPVQNLAMDAATAVS